MQLNPICESILSEESSIIIKDLILRGRLQMLPPMLRDLHIRKDTEEDKKEQREYIEKAVHDMFESFRIEYEKNMTEEKMTELIKQYELDSDD